MGVATTGVSFLLPPAKFYACEPPDLWTSKDHPDFFFGKNNTKKIYWEHELPLIPVSRQPLMKKDADICSVFFRSKCAELRVTKGGNPRQRVFLMFGAGPSGKLP